MIGKAKSISHGINDIRYITGESRNKKHPERIFHVGDNLLPPGLDATGIWDSMRLTLEKSKRVKNSVIRIEVSPAPEHTKDFTIDDWQRLWDDFTDEFDNIELLDKNGIQHTEAVMYRTVSNDFTPDEEFDYDMLVFFSPAGVTSLKKNFPDFDQKEIKIGTFGSTTAQAVRDAGLRLDLEAPTVQAPSMTAALDMFIKENNK